MRYALLTLLAATSGVALAQSRPQLTWQGYVSGSAVLHIQGDRVDVQGRDTGSVDRPTINMYEPLPAARQTVQMDVRRGRGRVQVVEHPTPRNEFTATVRIDPVGTRHELFVIDFFWDASGDRLDTRRNRRADDDYYGYGTGTRSRTNDRYVEPGEMTWSGTVDHEALIEVRGQRVNVRTLRGQRVYGSNPSFSSALPRQDVSVRLGAAEGRGRVDLVEQPSPNNNYAAVVRILDEDSGAGQYAFRLVWDDGDGSSDSGAFGTNRNDPYTPNRGAILTPQGGSDPYYGSPNGTGGMRWSGRVDGTVRVSVRGNRAWSTRVSGQPVYGEQAAFGSALPARSVGGVDVRKVRGRGDVRVLQHPSANNGNTLVFEIEDKDGGADNYQIEVLWR